VLRIDANPPTELSAILSISVGLRDGDQAGSKARTNFSSKPGLGSTEKNGGSQHSLGNFLAYKRLRQLQAGITIYLAYPAFTGQLTGLLTPWGRCLLAAGRLQAVASRFVRISYVQFLLN
jgi:hypothetical protein